MGFSKKNKELLILMALILLKFTMQQFLIDPIYELHRDEFLYLDQANHIAMGYSSVPLLPLGFLISYIYLETVCFGLSSFLLCLVL